MAEFTEHVLYDGKVKIKFYEESHQYWVSVKGSQFKRKPGATTVIGIKDKSKALSIWQQQITAEFLFKMLDAKEKITKEAIVEAVIQNEIQSQAAADIGKEAHAWCEAFIRFHLKQKGFEHLPEMPKTKEATMAVTAFLEWWDSHKVKPRSTEEVLYSMKYDFMGTMDLDADVDGFRSLVDLKTSNGLYNGVRLQTRAYQLAKEEEAGKPIYKRRWALRISKYTEEEYYAREEEKKLLKQQIAKIRGWAAKDYPIKPYQAFEAKLLDEDDDAMEVDKKGFLDALGLYRWDAATDFYKNAM